MFGSGKDGRLVKKDYEKILKMYKNKAVLELIKESTTYTVKELKAKIAEMGFNKKDYILMRADCGAPPKTQARTTT